MSTDITTNAATVVAKGQAYVTAAAIRVAGIRTLRGPLRTMSASRTHLHGIETGVVTITIR